MTRAAKSTDISEIRDVPAFLRLIEEVSATGEPCVLKQGEKEIAQITPVKPEPRRRRKPRVFTESDALFNIIGIATSKEGGPHDVSDNVDKYLAEAHLPSRP